MSSDTIAMGYTVAYTMLGVSSCAMELHAARPGVLVIPPVSTPNSSNIESLKNHLFRNIETTSGTRVIIAPTSMSVTPDCVRSCPRPPGRIATLAGVEDYWPRCSLSIRLGLYALYC